MISLVSSRRFAKIFSFKVKRRETLNAWNFHWRAIGFYNWRRQWSTNFSFNRHPIRNQMMENWCFSHRENSSSSSRSKILKIIPLLNYVKDFSITHCGRTEKKCIFLQNKIQIMISFRISKKIEESFTYSSENKKKKNLNQVGWNKNCVQCSKKGISYWFGRNMKKYEKSVFNVRSREA